MIVKKVPVKISGTFFVYCYKIDQKYGVIAGNGKGAQVTLGAFFKWCGHNGLIFFVSPYGNDLQPFGSCHRTLADKVSVTPVFIKVKARR